MWVLLYHLPVSQVIAGLLLVGSEIVEYYSFFLLYRAGVLAVAAVGRRWLRGQRVAGLQTPRLLPRVVAAGAAYWLRGQRVASLHAPRLPPRVIAAGYLVGLMVGIY